MSKIRSKILAFAATLTLAGGVTAAGAVTAGTASAGTPSCGATCINTYPAEYAGTSLGDPQFVVDVYRQGEKAGQPVILFRSSNADPAEDWVITDEDPASDFYAVGLLSSEMALEYGCTTGGTIVVAGAEVPCNAGASDAAAWQDQYAPFGVESGLCMGVAATAFSGEGVTLQPCGASARTVWLEDTNANDKSPVTLDGTEFWAALNGSGTSFSNPLALTYAGNAYPTDKPRVQLVVDQLGQFSNGTPNDDNNQLWTGVAGVLP
jgi:hypothetical protein